MNNIYLIYKIYFNLGFFTKMVIEKRVSKALVLENNTAEDVSRAMIEGGLQKDPFYIFDMDKAYQRVQYFKNMMPRIKIFYGGVFIIILFFYINAKSYLTSHIYSRYFFSGQIK